MQTLLMKIRTALTGSGEQSPSGDRLDGVVARQRGLRAASVQERLSRQQTDDHSEEATPPLYGESAYSSANSGPAVEPRP